MTPLAHGRRTDEPADLVPVRLSLPTALLERFRSLAEELLATASDVPSAEMADARFVELLRHAVLEAMTVHSADYPLERPPLAFGGTEALSVLMPGSIARAVERLARASNLSPMQAWHRVVLEFCERSEAPGLGEEVAHGR